MLLLSGLYTSISILQKMKKNNAETLGPRLFFRCRLSAAEQARACSSAVGCPLPSKINC